MDAKVRKEMPLFSMSVVRELTSLTGRQIRNYETHGLIHPERSVGNRRIFSFNDIDRLLEIKEMMDKGINLAGIKHVLQMKEVQGAAPAAVSAAPRADLTDDEVMKVLKRELMHAGRPGQTSMIQGELSRFFH